MTVSRSSAWTACFLGYLLPGAGHLYLRRRGRALALFALVATLFVVGVALQARLQMYVGLEDPLSLLRSLAQMAVGVPYFLARVLGFDGQITAVSHEYGNTFTEVGGLMNILVMLDAYDIALGRKP